MTRFIAANTMKSINQQKRQSLDYINVSFAMFSWPFISLSWLFTCLLFIMSNEGKNKDLGNNEHCCVRSVSRSCFAIKYRKKRTKTRPHLVENSFIVQFYIFI